MRINKNYRTIGVILILIITGSFFFLKKQKPSSLNVILITIDALRPDHLGCYGYSRNTSPNIDKLAEDGVKFSQAITQAPVTGSSVCSFLTSSYLINKVTESLNEETKEKLRSLGYIQ